ncbi:TIM-barrel domain-containing protein [Agarilytica rhodophyticola]|uniref:glycoside hydrolase family 31 protein n=1 Tax=Agarilytica rhodophyticola TaxID=1737490 RepID=UPI000B34366B|nr:TIM-barrel domain-containing protein [Agarilytica rhodophyticola]
MILIRKLFASSLTELVFFVTIVFLSTICLTPQVQAQNSTRLFENHVEHPGYLELMTSDGKISITPFSDKIIEVQFLTTSQPANPASHTIVSRSQTIATSLYDNKDKIIYRTPGIHLEIIKQPFQIKYFYLEKSLISEQAGYFEEAETSGFKFNMQPSEVIYGGGARALPMNRKGYTLSLYNTPAYGYTDERADMYFSLPLIMSSKGYMVLFDNPAKGTLDIGQKEKNILSMSSMGGRKTYYLIAGDDFFDLNTQYTQLTGRQPLPPRWMLGNIASRFGYHSQQETENTILQYKKKSVPVDAVVLDLFWFGKDIKGHMGNLDWDYSAWPKPVNMMKNFHKQGVNTILITEPFILQTSKRWQDAIDADILAKDYRGKPYIFDFYFGTGGLIDIFKPEAKQWFWEIYKKHMKAGVSAWWGDLGEPESHASDMVHVNGTADYVHNIFGHEWAKTLYQGYAQDFPKRRPAVLMRAGFAGSQRYGMIPWSGDVSRSWAGLQSQPTLAMQMGMQGFAYSHSDLGGFAPFKDKEGVLFSDPMLYTRWLQYGVFQPVFRPHSHESSPAEPVFWDDRTLRLTRQAINLRYQLLPYNYSLAYENSSKGYPFMRPLFYREPNNKKLFEYSEAYLWGDNILVAPILKPQQATQEVYFPAGNNWVDFYTGKKYIGGNKQTIKLVDEYIPTFVRTGSFLPMQPSATTQQNFHKSTKKYSTRYLEVLYYADQDTPCSSYTLYDDDGKTHKSIEQGKYEILNFTCQIKDGQHIFNLTSNKGRFKGKPRTRYITFLIRHLEQVPEQIHVNGNKIEVINNSNIQPDQHKQYALKLNNQTLRINVKFSGDSKEITF